ncbi:TIGR02680 family protein [Streptomyces sp. 6N223]|uniref:TIGR02680 family protein n=1 Tax=Streptomyces sp. 6N223 TaxID=3457412 RepID=UPI003FD18142
MDNRTRAARETEEAYQKATEENAATEERLAQTEATGEELAARIRALTESDAYREGRQLDELRRRVGDARRDAEGRRRAAGRAVEEAAADERTAAEVAGEAEKRQGASDDAEAAARQAARRAGMAAVCDEVAAALADDDEPRARHLANGAVHARNDSIARVRTAWEAHRTAERDRASAETLLEDAREKLAAATGQRTRRSEEYETAVAEQAERLRVWARGCVELVLGAAAVDELADRAPYESEVTALVEAAVRVVDREVTEARTLADQRLAELTAERARLTKERDELRRSKDLPPEPPRTRTADRTTLPGAPLWRLVAFRDHVPAEEQAAVEAALEAAGLLDAWVGPHGGLLAPGHDTFAEPDPLPPAPSGSLADALRPEPDGPVPVERVARLLAAIAYGETLPPAHPAAVGADGTWRLAATTGSWSKPESAHIGALARERARERRIAELKALVDGVDASVRQCEQRIAELAARRATLDRERGSLPDHEPVAAARRALDQADAEVGARDDAVREAMRRLDRREAEVVTARRRLDAAAAEHGLPAGGEALARLAAEVEGFRERTADWLAAALRLAGARRVADDARRRAVSSRERATAADEDARQRESTARSLAASLEETERAVGAEYREVLDRIEAYRGDERHAREETRRLEKALRGLADRIGELRGRLNAAAQERDTAIAARDAAAHRLHRHATLGLAADAGGEPPRSTGVTAALETARAVAAAWPSVPHAPKNIADALGRLDETRHQAEQALSDRADLTLETVDETDHVRILTATVDGVTVGATRLLALLAEERGRSRDDITTAERELFDRTLTGDTRRHLAARIRQANELVDGMNARLERVRTASNVAVRLVWQVDPTLPAGTRSARDLLLKDPVRMTDADREALHRFFRDRVEEAKQEQRATSWEEQLAQVLDYTAWHQFVVKLDRANGQGWQLLTKKLHGALSGGEKAIALHLPLFAAVAAHYQSVPEAPRLILLDEVFVGVDTTNRGQVFDLLSSLDLDLLLTSDHEWCTYRELHGIAIHQLITDGDDDAVTTARFVWDGAALVPADTDQADPTTQTAQVTDDSPDTPP